MLGMLRYEEIFMHGYMENTYIYPNCQENPFLFYVQDIEYS